MKESSYKISVIVPVYNAEKTLNNAIDSVINQSFGFENIEIILVDDCSNDGTKDIINDLANEYENIVPIFLESNSGLPSNPRNIGIRASTTEYIMFLDNDDYYYPNICEKLYSLIISYNADLVVSRHNYCSNSILKKPLSFFNKYEDFMIVDSVDEFPELFTNLGVIWDKIFKKRLIIKNNIKFPEEILSEDIYFSLKYYFYCNKIILLNNFFGYRHTIDSQSLSHNLTEQYLLRFFAGFLELTNLLKEFNKTHSPIAHSLIGMQSLIFMKSLILLDSNPTFKLDLLTKMKPYFKMYKYNTRLLPISIHLNVFINIFIKISSIHIHFPIYVSKIYRNLTKFYKN
ncbi:putative glycosyltransferase EpsH [Methanobrevibacter cuticularis]|uniref:Putative glycosyltransferase EpsH n=1 Tax=Methanobrevibacter cuticularis TaxID=47311 RepID=A0A166FC04_9EURY|nr:glycosyltransferase family 2 protein [Methanobrevibacter cuticularis]KZX17516.1 putative glycosyltransferase EpsH [Methanobrevibacter cuticularis]